MTTGNRGSGGDLDDDPLARPASDAGWDDERPAAKPAPAGDAASVKATPASPAPAKLTSAPPSPTVQAIAASPASDAPENATPADGAPANALPPSAGDTASSTEAPPAGAADTAKTEPSLPAAAPIDEAILPAVYDENELRAAVGATPRASASPVHTGPAPRDRRTSLDLDDDDDMPRPRGRKALATAVLVLLAAVSVIAIVLVGRVNSDRYVLACEAERAVAQQGRTFPPWGTRALPGEAWTPLKITAETRCQPHEVDDELALERLYLAMLLDQAAGLVTAADPARLDDADALLKQALLLTRPPETESAELAKQRAERYAEVQRLVGDVTYGRAAVKIREAAAVLGDAAKQFDSAATQRPRHASDAAAWASYARRLADQLHAGPAAMPPVAAGALDKPASQPAETQPHPAPPIGTALPVEPSKPDAPSKPDNAPAPDPHPPTGGVLL